MPLQATSGAASYDAFGGGVPVVPKYIEDVFSTYLYTGNSTSGGTQTITNNIDLSTKGGMVWIKGRSAASNNILTDTSRGAGTTASNNQALSSNLTTAEDLAASYDFLSAFNTDGFTVKQGGTTAATRGTNYNAVTYASWTFREQPKFFDVVTFTFASGSPFTFNHSLGSTPACIIFKRTNNASNWITYHRGLNGSVSPNNWNINLNSTAAQYNEGFAWLTSITSTSVTISTDYFADGGTYVAYLFAHDAGGFGLTGTDNVISCGSYTGNGSATGPVVTLGYEPQWLLVKKSSGVAYWHLLDSMRGFTATGSNDAFLYPNTNEVEDATLSWFAPSATGFNLTTSHPNVNENGSTYIYIAIRRGPMKVPTTGSSVFKVGTEAGIVAYPAQPITGGFDDSNAHFIDAVLTGFRTGASTNSYFTDRLRGFSPTTADTASFATRALVTSSTAAEVTNAGINQVSGVVGAPVFIGFSATGSQQPVVNYAFRRSPSFFDEVCWTGRGTNASLNHNLTVSPTLIITKARSATGDWRAEFWSAGVPQVLSLNLTDAAFTPGSYTAPTLSVFYPADDMSATTYIAYLFATCAGVSKVGSYTGTATTKQIDCGFTGGARFVLIKRTDTTGAWYVWDTARGIVSGNDPYLLLNTTAAEVTNTDYIDTYSAGFELSSTAPAALNASGGTYIFLAIA